MRYHVDSNVYLQSLSTTFKLAALLAEQVEVTGGEVRLLATNLGVI
jgi:hypothetical protein